MELYAKIKDGKLTAEASQLVRQFLNDRNGKTVRIEITETGEEKLQQYGFLYGAVYPLLQKGIKDVTGENASIEDIDTLMKMRFWYTEIIDFETGQVTRLPNQKRKMNKSELAEYTENVLNFASEYLGVQIANKTEAEMVIIA